MVLWLDKMFGVVGQGGGLPELLDEVEVLHVGPGGGGGDLKCEPTFGHLVPAQAGVPEGLFELLAGVDPVPGGIHLQTAGSPSISEFGGEGGHLLPHMLMVGGDAGL